MDSIEKVVPVKLSSLNDLVRLAASTMIPGQFGAYIIRFEYKGRLYLGMLGVFRDYYKYYGIPVFYYYPLEGESRDAGSANYIVISTSDERIEFSKNPKPGVSIPIVSLAEKPVFVPDDI
ncbi:MAG: hypothetical protein OWQ48_02160 [Desulfurococcus sp.]|nr:hypothetical protein [Desulfurococcus sp.]